jgi:hypothetical protein
LGHAIAVEQNRAPGIAAPIPLGLETLRRNTISAPNALNL